MYIKEYISSCITCTYAKVPRHKYYRLLRQLSIPSRLWNSISMDFNEQLSASSGHTYACTAILVVVDYLLIWCIFIPADNITFSKLVKLFLFYVFLKHGVPSYITSDRDSKFVFHFFSSLGKAFNIHLHFTSSYHPEGDSQTERMNQMLEQYLCIYCNYQQDNWSELLPLMEFSYNNAPNATTDISLFFINKGYHPNISVHPE